MTRKKSIKKVTLLSLFAGRWQSWTPYWYGLQNLDYPKNRIDVLWYTNATYQFVEFLKYQASIAIKQGFNVRIIHDTGVPPSANAFVDKGQRTMEHAVTIASMYNSAMKHVKTDRVFFVEDDICIPSNTLKKLMKDLSTHRFACYVAGVQFDRHENRMFFWDIEKVPVGFNNSDKPFWRSFPPRVTWGVQKIGLGHLGCTLIDFERAGRPDVIFNPQVEAEGAEKFIGCDIDFCFRHPGKCLADYDIRAFHYDSKAKPH